MKYLYKISAIFEILQKKFIKTEILQKKGSKKPFYKKNMFRIKKAYP